MMITALTAACRMNYYSLVAKIPRIKPYD